jgi:CHAT domain-containing protein
VPIPQTDGRTPSPQPRPLSLPQSHPEPPLVLHDLAADRFGRSGLSGQREDLDEVIHLLTEDFSLPLARPTRNGIQTLFELTLALLHRFKKFGELEDINATIRYLRKLHDCPLESFNVPEHAVTTSLVEMLAARVKGEAGDALEDINEMLFLCHGLTSDTSLGYLASALQTLTRAVLDAYSRGKQTQSLDQAIGCLREALKTCSPGLHQIKFDLANLLAIRFLVHHVDNDYEEAKVLLDRVTVSRSPGDPSCSCRFQASALTAALGYAQSIINSNPEDSETAVSNCRSFLDHSLSFGDPLHPVITQLLACHADRGSKHIGPPQGAQAAHSEVDRLPFSAQLGAFRDGADESDIIPAPLPISLEEKIDRLRDLYSTARPGTEDQRKYLKGLVHCYSTKISLSDDTTVIEEAIKYSRRLLATTHPTDQSKFLHLSNLGGFLSVAFDRTKRVEYLDESITRHREVLQLDSAQLAHFSIIQRLIWSLSIRWRLFRRGQDLDEVMHLFALGVRDTYATDPSRFELACHWAYTARISRHHSLSTAYENAMSLMQSSLVFAPTLPIQHNRLVEKRDLYEKTPLNFASHHIRVGQIERAIETLEQGRALLWSEMRGLRTSSDQLRATDPVLAERFTAVNQELETLTTTASSNGSIGMDDGGPECDEWTGQFSGLMKRQHELLTKRDSLISQIRGQPGFENFLLPLSFDTLCSAASHGPVIIINHCKWRSDFIVLHNSLPSHIPTPSDFYNRANQLKVRLLNTREKYGLNSEHHELALSSVLTELYELVGRPVIKRLNELGIAQQSRVWWCPTSVFWDLPLHAMGPIPSDDGVTRYFSDLYISSYTPTLSALIASRRPGTQTSARPTLLVAQPSQSPPGAWAETLVIRGLDLQTTCLTSGNMTTTTTLESLQRHRFAHVAYHGTLKTAKPFDASMLFHNRERLTLLDIVRSRLPSGEFAFLPGSHTAELTDGSMPDEVLHISTAVQYSGFRSVIGTMWGLDDEDGRDLAENFYRSMFSGKKGVEPYYERSARALQHAMQQMRRSLPLVRWVNYVHYGA